MNLSESNLRSVEVGISIKEDDPSSSRVVEYVELWELTPGDIGLLMSYKFKIVVDVKAVL